MDPNSSSTPTLGQPPGDSKRGLFVVPKQPKRDPEKLKTFLSNGQVVIQSEFTDQLEILTAKYLAEYQPSNITERMLVNDLATAECRCDYVLRLQKQQGISGNDKLMATLVKYHTTNTRLYKRSLKMLLEIQKRRKREALLKPHLVKPKKAAEC